MVKSNSRMQKLIYFLLAFVLCFSFICSKGVSSNAYALSSTSYIDFSKSDVMTDLKSANETGSIKLSDYYFDPTGLIKKPSVCYFIEYGYAVNSDLFNEYYGLYVYFYNPQQIDIDVSSNQNKVQMSVGVDETGKLNDYSKFNLKFCSVSTGNDYKKFYKFKVDLTTGFNKNWLSENGRKYSVSGVELLTNGQLTANDYLVGGEYVFNGYGKGFGADVKADSTLTSEKAVLETVQLDVKHTYYRTGTSDKGDGYQNQIDSVYFSVPNDMLGKYGKLQRIKAEWYEYKTKNIVVADNDDVIFSDKTVYEYLSPCVDRSYSDVYNQDSFLSGMKGFYLYSNYYRTQNSEIRHFSNFFGNINDIFSTHSNSLFNEPVDIVKSALEFSLLFGVSDISSYDPYSSVESTGGVSGNDLYAEILSQSAQYYSDTNNGQYTSLSDWLTVKNGNKILSKYFENDIDDSRKVDNEFGKIQNGYSYYDFDCDTYLDDISYYVPSTDSNWDKFWYSFVWGKDKVDEVSESISPIVSLSSSDFTSDFSSKYYVNNSDIDSVKDFVKSSEISDETPYLFHFASSDYYSESLNFNTYNNNSATPTVKGYVANQSVFFDFDIIQLSFKSDSGVYTVIPVVSNPIDIVDDIISPINVDENTDWLKILKLIIALIALVLVLIVLAPVFPYIINAVVFVIMLPIRLISSVFKGVKKVKKRK